MTAIEQALGEIEKREAYRHAFLTPTGAVFHVPPSDDVPRLVEALRYALDTGSVLDRPGFSEERHAKWEAAILAILRGEGGA